jgi:predicted XRE-type DNA-binding protein
MSKNVFEDLGFSRAQAAALQARVVLALDIERYIAKHKLTQAKAAKVFGVAQPTISKIVRGDVTKLSVEYLIRMLARVGISVRVTSVQSPARRKALAA